MPPRKTRAMRETSKGVGQRRWLRDSPEALCVVLEPLLTELKGEGTSAVGEEKRNNTSYMNSTLFEMYDFKWDMNTELGDMLFSCAVPNKFLVIAWIYVLRASVENPRFKVTKRNIQRVFSASAMVAAKYLDEDAHENYYDLFSLWAVCRPSEMKLLEEAFLDLIRGNRRVRSQGITSEEKEMVRKALKSSHGDTVRRILTEEGVDFLYVSMEIQDSLNWILAALQQHFHGWWGTFVHPCDCR